MDDITAKQSPATPSEVALWRLRTSLQVLAAPAQDQLAYFPDFVCKADEMALDYDHWLTRLLDGGPFSADQAIALKALNDYLGDLSGTENSAVWSDDALRHDARWERVRAMARSALTAMGWPLEGPPPWPDSYIPTTPRQ